MRSSALLLLILGVALGSANFADAETTGGGRGGPFIEFHTNSISAFDSSVGGLPVVIGGTGYGYLSKSFRIGGSGGGGFAWTTTNNTHFALGYGGIIGEYIFAPWISLRLLLGGGGFDVEKVASQTSAGENLQRLGSGGFLLFYPSLTTTIPLQSWLSLQLNLGFFMPNDSRLQSVTITGGVLFGK